MINKVQEDKIRDLLSIVTIYFQFEQSGELDSSKESLLAQQKIACKESIEELIEVMSVDGSMQQPKSSGIRLVQYPNPENFIKVGNAILDKLGYSKDGRYEFIISCIQKSKVMP